MTPKHRCSVLKTEITNFDEPLFFGYVLPFSRILSSGEQQNISKFLAMYYHIPRDIVGNTHIVGNTNRRLQLWGCEGFRGERAAEKKFYGVDLWGKIDSVKALRKQPETLTDGQSGGTIAKRSSEAQ